MEKKNNKKPTPKTTNNKATKGNRFNTGGLGVPVDISKIDWANKPKK